MRGLHHDQQHHTVLYVGVTSDIGERIKQRKVGEHTSSFTRKYNVDELVYYDPFVLLPQPSGTSYGSTRSWPKMKSSVISTAKAGGGTNPSGRDPGGSRTL